MAKVLIVDDDRTVIVVLKALLTKSGHVVASAPDGYEAILKLQTELYDLVLCDMMMPHLSGFKVVKTIRKMEQYANVPIIFITGRNDKESVEKAVDAGVDDYVLKPLDPDIVSAKVETLLTTKPRIHAFKELPVKIDGKLTSAFSIIGLSEQGLRIQSPIPLPVKHKFRFETTLFEEIGMANPLLRVDHVASASDNESSFSIAASFVGLTNGDLQKIRVWLLANRPRAAAS